MVWHTNLSLVLDISIRNGTCLLDLVNQSIFYVINKTNKNKKTFFNNSMIKVDKKIILLLISLVYTYIIGICLKKKSLIILKTSIYILLI